MPINGAANDVPLDPKTSYNVQPELVAQITQNVIKYFQTSYILPQHQGSCKLSQSPYSNLHASAKIPKQMITPSTPSQPSYPLEKGNGETTLEKAWGPLFDEKCRPTARLGQFLRGLADYIVRAIHTGVLPQRQIDSYLQIENYEPEHSTVITPSKMIKYYEKQKLGNELYPWTSQ